MWKRSLGGSYPDVFNTVIITKDGDIVAGGYTDSNDYDMSDVHHNGLTDVLLVKYDSAGNIVWKRTYGGSSYEYMRSIVELPDGGFVVVSFTNSNIGSYINRGGYDAHIMKTDEDGHVQWENIFGGSQADNFAAVEYTQDGGYLTVGYSLSNDGDMSGTVSGRKGIIVKYDSNGNMVWKRNIGIASDLFGIAPVPGDMFVAVGEGVIAGKARGGSGTDGILVKFTSAGDIVPFTTAPPDVATFFADITVPTSDNVTVTILYPTDVTVKEYKIDDGEWLSYTGPIVMTNNGTIYARSQAANGMWSEISAYVVSNIVDEEDPVGEVPGENDPEEEGPDAGNPIGSHPISCNTDGTCNILPGMNKIHKVKYILAQRAEYVDIATLVSSNYDSISTLWN